MLVKALHPVAREELARVEDPENLGCYREAPQGLHAEVGHGLAKVAYGAPQANEGGVDQLEHLRRHSDVAGHYFRHVPERGFLVAECRIECSEVGRQARPARS